MSKGQGKAAHLLDLAGRNRARPLEIDIIADEALAADLAARVGADELRGVRLHGRAEATKRNGWAVTAELSGQACQPCVVTGEPVWTVIAAEIRRVYQEDLPEPGPGEAEMPEDIDLEPMPDRLNLIDLITEEIALALPDYPRAPDVPPVEVESAPEGGKADDEKPNPFSVLRDLPLKGGTGES